ncbi:MAG: protein of unknown function (DUF4102) [Glomeribacter sp. 1016415]|nr:protein of unknown function (DUF4102) [Glomeribacter sp. 1016415]
MPTNRLSDAKCKTARPAEKDYKLFDGGGLFLWISSKGGKIWRMAYRLAGKQQTISFGPYPNVSIKWLISKGLLVLLIRHLYS